MPRLDRSQAVRCTRWLAGARVGFGVAAMLAPVPMTRSWVGPSVEPARTVLARALGGRDIALGLGTLLAERRGSNVRGWLEAGALADAADAMATLSRFGSLPRRGRAGVLAVTVAAVVAAAVVAPALKPQP